MEVGYKVFKTDVIKNIALRLVEPEITAKISKIENIQ